MSHPAIVMPNHSYASDLVGWNFCESQPIRPPIRKAVVAISAQDDVIEHPDREHLSALFEASRNFLIFRARHRVAGRMIVHTDYGGRAQTKCC